MNDSAPLPLNTRSAIVLIALLQGLLLYVATQADTAWPFNSMTGQLCWNAAMLLVPTAITLAVTRLDDRRLWAHAGVGLLCVLALAGWVGWNLQGAPGLAEGPLVTPFALCMAVGFVVLLPWWQFRLASGHWRATYAALFEHAWQNALTLALAVAFTGLTWLLLWLWALLFMLVDIRFFSVLFQEGAFIALSTGTLMGFGILIGRTQQRAVQVTRQVLFAVCKGLLPLLAFIAVLFVCSLPFTGLEPLWKTRSAAMLLLSIVALLVVFANAVYQQDSDVPPYPAWLRRLVDASLLSLPIYAGLALYAVALRVAQHGWTLPRVWVALIALLLAGYALGYAWATLRRQPRWLQGIETVNRWVCWAVLAAAVLPHTPLLDPVRLSVHSQVARLQAQAPRIEEEDARVLRFELGRRGYQALQALRGAPGFRDDPGAVAVIDTTLARESRWHSDSSTSSAAAVTGRAALQRQLVSAANSPPPDTAWWDALLAGQVAANDCLRPGHPCVALRRDLDGDGRDEMLLCDVSGTVGASCQLHVLEGTQWRDGGTLTFWAGSTGRIQTAVRQGNITLHRPRWPQVSLDGGEPQDIQTPPPSSKDTP
ncbi:DUF4153 domain-containing protein [Stenotrophomonas sp. LGBM10]|uniref:DUF4153 domain-containing protein n=1 Tax=Stenotrophomonas sp. LGBM10 TaxID=3390038 RepID=UPI00398B22AC